MKISVRFIKDKDLFELQIVGPQLRAHFILNRGLTNKLRLTLEKALIESRKDKCSG